LVRALVCPESFRERGRPDGYRDTLHQGSPKVSLSFFMVFSVYIIYSAKLDKYYVGYTEHLSIRLNQHNNGESTFTSKANDWILKYTEAFDSREMVHGRELEIKRKKVENILNG
jgi:putative endonuclease